MGSPGKNHVGPESVAALGARAVLPSMDADICTCEA